MARLDIVDLRELAAPPTETTASGSALDVDYRTLLLQLAAQTGATGRVVLDDGDKPTDVQNVIKAAAIHDQMDVKIMAVGNIIYFYVNGPQPDEFIKQYSLRAEHAG